MTQPNTKHNYVFTLTEDYLSLPEQKKSIHNGIYDSQAQYQSISLLLAGDGGIFSHGTSPLHVQNALHGRLAVLQLQRCVLHGLSA